MRSWRDIISDSRGRKPGTAEMWAEMKAVRGELLWSSKSKTEELRSPVAKLFRASERSPVLI